MSTAYFDRAYQETLFKGLTWNQKGIRNDRIDINVNGNPFWAIDSTVDFDGKSSCGSRVLSNDSNGDGVAYKIEGGDDAMYYYPIAKNQLDTSKAERRALYSPQEFARMIIGVDPPVEEMSFKPKMDNISVFKKGNALMSYAAMPSDKTYALNAVGWAKQMALTHVSLFCYTHPWEEKEEGWYEWGCKISGYNEGSLVEVYWDINGRLN